MYSTSEGRKSVDSLASPSGVTHRADFPFHRQYPRQRRESAASSANSIGGSLDTAVGSGWSDSLHESGQNAISTLLQPPIVRTGLLPHTTAPAHSTHKPPTAKDIPPVALTNIIHVEASEFTSYLTQVGALHEQLRRVKESEDEQQAARPGLPRRNSSKDDLSDALNDSHLRPGTKRTHSARKLSISSVSSLSLSEAPSPVRRNSSGFGRRGNQGPPPLSTIPGVYFEEDFHLENPRTFDIVSERSEVVPSSTTTNSEKTAGSNGTAAAPAPRKALATNAILQEKLSWYMDTVEMHLISSISTASTAFFTALGSLKELHTEAADSVDRIKVLRAELGALDDEIAKRGLGIVRKQLRRQNMQQLHAAVVQLRDIVDDVAACETLVDEGEVDKALDGIDALEKFIAGEQAQEQDKAKSQKPQRLRKYRLRDLRGATALQGVNDDITTLRYRVGKAYEARFVAVLMQDIRQHTESVSHQEVLMRWNSASMRARGGHNREPSVFPAYLASTDELRSELLPIITGLYRAKHIAAATQVYRDSVLREIRNLVRKPLPSSNDDDNESMMSSSTLGSSRQRTQQEKSSTLARNLRALEPEHAEELLMEIYITVTETLRRLTTQVKVLLDVASSVGEDKEPAGLKSPPFSPTGRQLQQLGGAGIEAQGELHKTLDVDNLFGQAVDVAQDKIVKLLRVRTEQSSRLSLVLFLRYFTLNLHFANECEAISGRSGTTLKTVVNGQIKDFVQTHGNNERQNLAQGMDKDNWDAKDFTDKDNEILQRILNASTKDSDAWTTDVKLWVPVSTNDSDDEKDGAGTASSNGTAAATAAGGKKAKASQGAVIDSETFLLPSSAVLCLEGLSRFMHLTVAIPFMTADVASSLVQYLQLFDSRCKQLILGAGARITAGLKNITSGHLAVSSQALSFISTLIPHVREFIRRRSLSAPGLGGSVSGLMGEFDKVRRQYQEHQNSIYDKLVEIMGARAGAAANTVKTINWDNDTSSAVHSYMEQLAKNTSTLHRVLTKNLPEGTTRFIMMSVFSGYVEQLGAVLKAAEVKTKNGQDSMLRDVEYFQTRLGKIDGFDKAGEQLKNIALAKNVKAPTPAPAPVAETKASSGSTEESSKDKNGKEADKETIADTQSKDSGSEDKKQNGSTEEPKDEEAAKDDADDAATSLAPAPPPKDEDTATSAKASESEGAPAENTNGVKDGVDDEGKKNGSGPPSSANGSEEM